MAYRRRVPVGSATFSLNNQEISQIHRGAGEEDEQEEEEEEDDDHGLKKKSYPEKGSLGARATRASAAHRHSSAYASAYAAPTAPAPAPAHHSPSPSKESPTSSNDSKYGFWGILARKAKSILEEDYQTQSSPDAPQLQGDDARLRKRIDAFTSSLGNAFEEGRTIMEHKTADIIQETRNKFIQETRKLQFRRRGGTSDSDTHPDQATVVHNTSWQRPVLQPVQISALANQKTQLKASRDVAMATAAKAKVLLRELKTVKADLAFAKERCAQLEEENKRLRESREKGDNPADDDLIRLQLETLLAEKARLAHENSIYARENRFLREIVEYHQLTMQDVVYLDEGTEEVTEVYPFSIDDARMLSSTPKSSMSSNFLPEVSTLDLPPEAKEHTRETLKDVFSNTSSLLFPSSPPMIDPISCPPERTESSEVPISAQLQSVAEEINAS